MAEPTGRGEADGRFLRLLFLLALLLRLAFVWQIRDLPTQHWLVMDAQHYDALAREIAAGGWMPREVFYQAPLYPYFLALVYTVAEGSLLAVRLLQAVLGATAVVLLADLTRRLFGRGAGRAAGVLAALYGPAIFYVPLLLKPTLMLLALTGAVLLLVGPHPLTPSPAPPAPLPGRGGEGKRFGGWRPSPGEEGWGGGRGDGGEGPGEAGLGGRGLRRLLAAGALFGVSALLQEILILLVPCAAVWLLLPHSPPGDPGEAGSRTRRLAAVLALALGAGLGLAPATLLNVLAGGEAVLISSAGGVSFFIGNSRGASGTYTGLSSGSHSPASQREDSRRLAAAIATRERGRQVAPEELPLGEVSSLLWRESFREIRADPAAWGRLLLRKTRLFWNAYEIPDAEGYDVYRRQAGPLTLLWTGFGIVAPLGLAGLVLAWREPRTRRGAALLTLLLACLCAAVVLFFVFGRYRLPVVVLLLPPAGYALAALTSAARRREPRRLAAIAAAAGLAALAVNLPAWPPAERARLDTAIWFNLSTAALRGAEASTEPEEAVALTSRAADDLARVLELSPGFYVARVQRAAALHRRGAYLANAGDLEAGLASAEEARRELSIAQASGGGRDLPEAESQARVLAASLDAGTAQILVNLGAQRIEAGDLDRAEAALRRAVAVAPTSAPAHGNLGLCLLQQGRRAERSGDETAAGRLRAASRAAFAQALALTGPESRPGEAAFYRRGLELSGG